MNTIVFDLDGTLADTSADLIAAANTVLAARGLGRLLDPARDQATAFRGGRAMLRLGFARATAGEGGQMAYGERDVEQGYPALLEAYAGALDRETRLYPGAAEAVERMREAGHACAVCTNKPEALAEALLGRLGLRDLFAALVGADTLPVRKPDPAPLRAAVSRSGGALAAAMLVGDTDTDRETARAAGIPCALVTFGPEGDAVARLGPEALLESYSGLDGVVARLLPAA